VSGDIRGVNNMKIHKTKNYERFGKVIGNRKIVSSHVKKLEGSILKENMLENNPIVVNRKMDIIDGQHRLEVSKKNDLYIYYTVVEDADLKNVQQLNANNRSWNAKDYLDSFIQLGYDDYIMLADFMREFDLPLAISRNLLSGAGSHGCLSDFKNGKFVVKNLHNARLIASRLADLKNHVEMNVWKDREFIKALSIAYKIIDHKGFLHKLDVFGAKITKERTTTEYLRQVESIYNYKRRSKVRLF